MKLLSFVRLGKTGFGAVVKDGIIYLNGKLDPEINSIKEKLVDLTLITQQFSLDLQILKLLTCNP